MSSTNRHTGNTVHMVMPFVFTHFNGIHMPGLNWAGTTHQDTCDTVIQLSYVRTFPARSYNPCISRCYIFKPLFTGLSVMKSTIPHSACAKCPDTEQAGPASTDTGLVKEKSPEVIACRAKVLLFRVSLRICRAQPYPHYMPHCSSSIHTFFIGDVFQPDVRGNNCNNDGSFEFMCSRSDSLNSSFAGTMLWTKCRQDKPCKL